MQQREVVKSKGSSGWAESDVTLILAIEFRRAVRDSFRNLLLLLLLLSLLLLLLLLSVILDLTVCHCFHHDDKYLSRPSILSQFLLLRCFSNFLLLLFLDRRVISGHYLR